MALYFAYGMNCNSTQMARRCPAAIALGHATLPGHRLRFAGCADIIPSGDHQVDGVLWDITPDCRIALDALEGFPEFYNIKTVMVKHRQRHCSALVYYMTPGHTDSPPFHGYLNSILDGYGTFGVPRKQIDLALAMCTTVF